MAPASVPAAQGAPQPPNAQQAAVLARLEALGPLPIEALNPRQARELPSFTDAVRAEALRRGLPTVEPVGSVQHTIIPGGAGSDGTLIRIYTPAAAVATLPVVLYFHGGGFVIANLDVYDPSCRALTNATRAIVVSVAYRQAPGNPFPAAPDDAVAAYEWLLRNAGETGDPRRIAVAGESAGVNLANVVAVTARDRGLAPPAHQVLVYPASDFGMGANRPSALQYFDAKPLNRPALQWFATYYRPDPDDAMNPKASPLLADQAGLPLATVIAAKIDPPRDTSRAHADKLQAANVPVTFRLFEGVTHEFFGAGVVIDAAKKAVALAASGLRASFGG